MSKRKDCLEYVVKNYNNWPAKEDSGVGAATHHGYRWTKRNGKAPWILVNASNDVITEADFYAEWEDSIKMSDHIDMSNWDPSCLAERDPDDIIRQSFSVAQARAMWLALAKYDGMKAKLGHARKTINRLANELGE